MASEPEAAARLHQQRHHLQHHHHHHHHHRQQLLGLAHSTELHRLYPPRQLHHHVRTIGHSRRVTQLHIQRDAMNDRKPPAITSVNVNVNVSASTKSCNNAYIIAPPLRRRRQRRQRRRRPLLRLARRLTLDPREEPRRPSLLRAANASWHDPTRHRPSDVRHRRQQRHLHPQHQYQQRSRLLTSDTMATMSTIISRRPATPTPTPAARRRPISR